MPKFSEVDQPEEKEDDLDPTDDGEPGEEPHGASDETELCLKLDFFIPLYLVKGCRVKVDLNQVNRGFWNMIT